MSETLKMALGRVVKRRRARLGFSQERFAFEASIDRRYMSDIERGATNLTLEMLERVAAGLGMSASKLLADAEKEVDRSAG